ncbi:MAG TPA: class I SAM-dependent methyltransferase [Allosphingosinicella sp.]|nr:class I SAM-dependent methyltransferase [Allosphingosinicella sp.]
MERIVYDRMAELDATHWWYRARRTVLSRLIARNIALPAEARILEVGCGTGHNLQMLREFGRVDATEIDGFARVIASKRLGHAVRDSALPELKGVPERTYDLVAILDVLEHVEEDRDSLASMKRRLRPGGHILVTVPAHPWMWSAHDEVNHHKRRYTKKSFRAAVEDSGLRLDLITYFNSLLFPVAAAARLAGRATGNKDSDDSLPPAPLNRMLETIFRTEAYAIGRLPFPPGVSLAAILSAS